MQHGFVELPLAAWRLGPESAVHVTDLLSDERYTGAGAATTSGSTPRPAWRTSCLYSWTRRCRPNRRWRADPRMPETPNPLWYKDAVIYQAHVRAFFDSTNDGIGDFAGLTAEAGVHRKPGRQHAVAPAVLPVSAARRRLRHRGLREHPPELRHAGRLRSVHRGGAPAADPRHHRAGHQPHVGPAPVVPGRARRARRITGARLLRLERHEPEIPGRPHHLHRHREIELDLGRHGQGVLLASVLPPPAGSELRQPGGPRRRGQGDAVLARSRRRRSASRRRAVPDRARGHDLREPRGDARSS